MNQSASKHDVLRLDELEGYRVNPVLESLIQGYCTDIGRSPAEVRILDWGCGRGRGVLKLRQAGYDCRGVDIDPGVLRNAEPAFSEAGLDASRLLGTLTDDGFASFEDDDFDVVVSDQVLEHVVDPVTTLSAMAAVLRPGGVMFHCFPAHRGLVECHLGMPFVHWLPKNRLRKALVAAWLRTGIDPGWNDLSGSSIADRTRAYYEYSTQHTFYRSPREWRRLFESIGFRITFVSHLAPGIARVRRALAPLSMDGVINRAMTNLRMVYLSARRIEAE